MALARCLEESHRADDPPPQVSSGPPAPPVWGTAVAFPAAPLALHVALKSTVCPMSSGKAQPERRWPAVRRISSRRALPQPAPTLAGALASEIGVRQPLLGAGDVASRSPTAGPAVTARSSPSSCLSTLPPIFDPATRIAHGALRSARPSSPSQRVQERSRGACPTASSLPCRPRRQKESALRLEASGRALFAGTTRGALNERVLPASLGVLPLPPRALEGRSQQIVSDGPRVPAACSTALR